MKSEILGVIGFVIGWAGSYYLVEYIFHSEWNNVIYPLIGVVLGGILAKIYKSKAEQK